MEGITNVSSVDCNFDTQSTQNSTDFSQLIDDGDSNQRAGDSVRSDEAANVTAAAIPSSNVEFTAVTVATVTATATVTDSSPHLTKISNIFFEDFHNKTSSIISPVSELSWTKQASLASTCDAMGKRNVTKTQNKIYSIFKSTECEHNIRLDRCQTRDVQHVTRTIFKAYFQPLSTRWQSKHINEQMTINFDFRRKEITLQICTETSPNLSN